MNEAAASALQPLTIVDPPPAVLGLSEGLRDKFALGLTCNEGAWIFTDHVGQWAAVPASASEAIAKTGWRDLTGYECNVNAFHLEDYAPVSVTITDGCQPQIDYEDQIALLRLGLVVADNVFGLMGALPEPFPARCIVSANDTCVIFRFHGIRAGEEWAGPDLDGWSDMMVIIDRHP